MNLRSETDGSNHGVQVALLPELIDSTLTGRVAVVIDVLRATTTIVEALAGGAKEVIPCLEVDEARKRCAAIVPRPLLGGERGGEPIDGFDAGNSPLEYPPEIVAGRSLVFTTTNGTRAMSACGDASGVVLAAFTNLSAVVDTAAKCERLTIVCAGTNGAVTMEDALLAGAICDRLAGTHRVENDQARMVRRLWSTVNDVPSVEDNLADVLRDSQGGRNLVGLGRNQDIDFAAEVDRHSLLPHLVDGVIRSDA